MISTGKFVRRAGFGGFFLCKVGLAATLSIAAPAIAQEVVQPLPPQASQDLNNALRALASDPRNVPALLSAGNAALELRDPEAAVGFFRRAEGINPGNAGIQAGLARAALQQGDPVEAILLFKKAEAAGIDLRPNASERGLAYDLVGDNGRAQEQYRLALTQENDPAVSRMLALSQSIAGDANGAETTLLPLLQGQDRAAYRTRAFALAIMDRTEEAVTISDAMLPKTLSTRLTPYLRLMPRLTKAQQAAAANLGQFPTAAQMGRDDPKIASYAGQYPPLAVAAPAVSSDQRLAPAGEPMGRSRRSSSQRQPSRQQDAVRNVTGGKVEQLPSVPIPATEPVPVEASAPQPGPTEPPVAAQQESRGELPPLNPEQVPQQASRSQAAAAPPAPGPAPSAVSAPAPLEAQAPAQPEMAAPSISIARAEPEPEPEPEVVNLAEVFADFDLPEGSGSSPPAGAVDITAFEPPRERPAPAPPTDPSRQWVQVATGRDLSALGFDWRRIRKNSGNLLDGKDAFTAKWGETNRLLTGPFDSADAAQEMVTKLKEQGVDSFRFTSAQGEEVKPLN